MTIAILIISFILATIVVILAVKNEPHLTGSKIIGYGFSGAFIFWVLACLGVGIMLFMTDGHIV